MSNLPIDLKIRTQLELSNIRSTVIRVLTDYKNDLESFTESVVIEEVSAEKALLMLRAEVAREVRSEILERVRHETRNLLQEAFKNLSCDKKTT